MATTSVPKKNRVDSLHRAYIRSLDSAHAKSTFEYWATEHLRVSGVYWALGGMSVLNWDGANGGELGLPTGPIVEWLVRCQEPNTGGFGGNEGHDAHLLYTLSAVQVLAMTQSLHRIDVGRVAAFVAALQQADGSFAGDRWCEIDTRFSYCALACLAILGRLDLVDVDNAVRYIARCKNFDGAFGCIPDGESHAGQTFCCVGALAIVNRLDVIDADLLGWWLAERQLKNGGLNGRPEKLADVCYSWWVLSCLTIIDRLHWIDRDALVAFILDCQDTQTGGFADRPGDVADVYHTFFALCGLSFLGEPNLAPIDPAYALPTETVDRLGLKRPWARAAAAVKP